jgi:Peptidase A4 family
MTRKHRLALRPAVALLALSGQLAASGLCAADTTGATGRTGNTQQAVSANWAGYIVQSKAGQSFSSVSGSWTEPPVTSGAGDGYSSFWVGLGGASPDSNALEQIGTSADVADGEPEYSAWYELIPEPETKLDLTVHPGDRLSARVTVNGTDVNMALTDQTTGQSVTKALTMRDPDTSSAEWIAEAPSTETAGGESQILPLADFGKVTFTDASASAGGHTGSISDPNWTTQETQLNPSAGSGFIGGGSLTPGPVGQTPGSGGASTSDLSADGTTFSVSYSANPGSPAIAGG